MCWTASDARRCRSNRVVLRSARAVLHTTGARPLALHEVRDVFRLLPLALRSGSGGAIFNLCDVALCRASECGHRIGPRKSRCSLPLHFLLRELSERAVVREDTVLERLPRRPQSIVVAPTMTGWRAPSRGTRRSRNSGAFAGRGSTRRTSTPARRGVFRPDGHPRRDAGRKASSTRDVPVVSQYFEDGRTGIACPIGDKDRLAQLIDRCIGDWLGAQRSGRRRRRRRRRQRPLAAAFKAAVARLASAFIAQETA